MQTTPRETVLNNGRQVFCLDGREAALVYEQVKLYFDHGITVRGGDTVFDVGANIGLFSIHAYELAQGDLHAFAFEPIPTTHEVLTANFARINADRLKAFGCGVAAEAGSAVFAYYPHHSTLSTAFWDEESEKEMREQLRTSVHLNMEEVPESISKSYPLFRLLRMLPNFARTWLINWMTTRSFGEAQKFTCTLRTISDVIREHGVERIDLLKVDAEKSELDVLRGIDPADWTKIRQVVMEIHDIQGRMATIRELLETHGLSHITVEQEPALVGSNVYSLFALRAV